MEFSYLPTELIAYVLCQSIKLFSSYLSLDCKYLKERDIIHFWNFNDWTYYKGFIDVW